jgi:hypothetical protein
VRRSPNRTSFVSLSRCDGENERRVGFAVEEKLRFLPLRWRENSLVAVRYDDKIRSSDRHSAE